MHSDWRLARRHRQRPGLLLVEPDLGRRTTLAVALGTRYAVRTAGNPSEALAHAASTPFALAVLDAGTLGKLFPVIVSALRARQGPVAIVAIAGRHDLRAHHYAARLRVDAVLGRRATAYALLDHIARLLPVRDDAAPVDRRVARAIDLMARDVIHVLDVDALAETTGIARAALADSFRLVTDLTVDEYVTCVRVALAEQLLRDTTLGMDDLAGLLGFGDVDALASAFAALSPA